MMPIVSRRPLIVGSDVAGALLGVLAARMLRAEARKIIILANALLRENREWALIAP